MRTFFLILLFVLDIFMGLIGLGMVVVYALASYHGKSIAGVEIAVGVVLASCGIWFVRLYKNRTTKSWEDIIVDLLWGWWSF